MRGSPDEHLAIIGMACRLPGAANPDALWARLMQREAPAPSPGPAAPARLEEAAAFDPKFFGLSGRDAALIDPQHRLFLLCAAEALEEGCVAATGAKRDIGVFAGCAAGDYAGGVLHAASPGSFPQTAEELQILLCNGPAFLPARVSQALRLTGPSACVQAACATGLVALHLASQSVLRGECSMALAGAAAIRLPQERPFAPEPGMILSPDGHARPFDAAAAGTAYGDGVGVVLLKPLEAAIEDGNPIHAVLRGTAIGNDGGSGLGFAAPSAEGQAAVIAQALRHAGCTGDSVGLVETHGTGTPLGDPIELAALAENYASPSRSAPCALSAAKAVFGHAAEAAGLVGLIAAVMALKRRTMPPIRHFEAINPAASREGRLFRINRTPRPWRPSGRARAGVSAFGMGGFNAHAVLEAAPVRATAGGEGAFPVLLSARSPEGLRVFAARLRLAMMRDREIEVADIALTLAAGRGAQPWRAGFPASSRRDLARGLRRVWTAPPALPVCANAALDGSWGMDGDAAHVCALFIGGGTVGKSSFQGRGGRLVHLPPTPFDLSDYWPSLRPEKKCMAPAGAASLSPRREPRLPLGHAARAYISQAFTGLGVTDLRGGICRDALRRAVSPEHLRWAERLGDILLQKDEEEAYDDRPGLTEAVLLRRVGENLIPLLQGRMDVRAVLFPAGRADLVARFYRESASLRAMNRIAARMVSNLADAAGHRVRLIEIGAGTLSTTRAVLAACQGDALDYTVTDLGAGFVADALRRRSGRPFTSAARLDIERPAEAQGFEPGSYDIVLAANVLHCARDAASALRHASSLMRPGGRLILIEGTAPVPWAELVFGGLPGWWRFDDEARRGGHPLLTAETWTAIAEAEGLRRLERYETAEEEGGRSLPQALLCFERPLSEGQTVSPRTASAGRATEEIITARCAALVGVPIETVGVHDSFAAMGLDSLAMLELQAALQQDLSGPVPDLGADDTPMALAARLRAKETPAAPVPCRVAPRGGVRTGRPILLFPSIFGDNAGLGLLAGSLGTSGPVFDVVLDPSCDPLIDRRADLVAQALSSFDRPVLVGHSYGGILAFATAAALEARGAVAGGLVILDMPPILAAAAGTGRRWEQQGVPLTALARRHESGMAALAAYRTPFMKDADILLVRASEQRTEDDFLPGEEEGARAPAWGWQHFTARPVRTVFVPGDHLSMLAPRHMPLIARNIAAHVKTMSDREERG